MTPVFYYFRPRACSLTVLVSFKGCLTRSFALLFPPLIYIFVFSSLWWVENRKHCLKWSPYLAIPVAALHFDCTIPDSSTSLDYRLSRVRFLGTVLPAEFTVRLFPTFFSHCTEWEAILWNYVIFNCFFFLIPLERIRSGSIIPCVITRIPPMVTDRWYLRPLAHAVATAMIVIFPSAS
jgi:hypothetical protein